MKSKKILSLLLALGVMAVGLTACGEKEKPNSETTQEQTQQEVTPPVEEKEEENMQIPNPVVSYGSVEEAVQMVGHLNPLPQIYERYNKEASVIDNTLIQIVYSDDMGEILTLREQAGGDEDISGNYNSYSYNDVVEIGGNDVTIKGDAEDSINLVIWNDGAYAHSLDYVSGVSLEEVTDVVNEING